MSVTLAQASSIVDATLKKARELKQMPQTVVVLDTGGHLVCAKREDGSGIIRFEIAVGKAYGALGMGWGSRTMMERAAQNPNFLTAIVAASGGRLVPNPGGVLIRERRQPRPRRGRHFRRHRRQRRNHRGRRHRGGRTESRSGRRQEIIRRYAGIGRSGRQS